MTRARPERRKWANRKARLTILSTDFDYILKVLIELRRHCLLSSMRYLLYWPHQYEVSFLLTSKVRGRGSRGNPRRLRQWWGYSSSR